jgi:hypothetical protein
VPLSRRRQEERAPLGLAVLADVDLRQLFSVLPVSPASRLEGRSDSGEIALQAVRRVAIVNSEMRAAVP